MPFNPNAITREHVETAVERILEQNIPLLPSTRWDVIIDGRPFPPKEIMRYAHEQMNGEKFWEYGGGEGTNKFLKKFGFTLIDKRSHNPVQAIIEKYKLHIRAGNLSNEIYKWNLIAAYKGRPDTAAADFHQELTTIDYANLIYPVAISVIRHIAIDKTEEYRSCFKLLFNESLALQERITSFDRNTLAVYRELIADPRLSHHQDERTMSTFLAFHNPDKYPLFKDSFYQKYCKLIGVKSKKKGEKYVHYCELVNDFIGEYIADDTELTEIVRELLPPQAYDDPNYKLLAQDIFYQMLDKGMEELDIENFAVYKISMGDFSGNEIEQMISENKISVHKNTKAKGVSAESQGDLFQNKMKIGDYFYLTHGNGYDKMKLFGRITSAASPTLLNNYGDDGWLDRSFELVAVSKNKTAYKGTNKWWTPNNNSTCIAIKREEIEEANKLLFEPYFMTRLIAAVATTEDASTDENNNEPNELSMSIPLNQILFGPPGTGKTYSAITKALAIIEKTDEDLLKAEPRKLVKERFDKLLKREVIMFTTFHQSMSYEDFMEGIKPKTKGTDVIYEIQDGIFKKIATKASINYSLYKNPDANFEELFELLKSEWQESDNGELNIQMKAKTFAITYIYEKNIDFRKASGGTAHDLVISTLKDIYLGNRTMTGGLGVYYNPLVEKLKSYKVAKASMPLQNYVIVIDEINRGNISQIFGELITLIEENKRIGKDEALEIMLPYSKEKFSVPPNLYIIGTMNTADRSVEALDTALRRRFTFEEINPDSGVIQTKGKAQSGIVEGIDLAAMMEKLNIRIEKLLDKDHKIGHSYFLKVDSIASLKYCFKNEIIPLLEEYFFGDYGKIGLVLGNSFVALKPAADNFAIFDGYDTDVRADLKDKPIYIIRPEADWNFSAI